MMDRSSLPDPEPHVVQQSSVNQHTSVLLLQQPVYPLNLAHLLASQTSYPPMTILYQSFEEMWDSSPAYVKHEEIQPWSPVAMSSTLSQDHPQNVVELQVENRDVLIGSQDMTVTVLPGSTGNINGFQLLNPSSILPQGNIVVFEKFSDQKNLHNKLQMRSLRLMRNCQSARKYRQKKKDYIRRLENRVHELENQNKTLIDEIRVFTNIYQHKVE